MEQKIMVGKDEKTKQRSGQVKKRKRELRKGGESEEGKQ